MSGEILILDPEASSDPKHGCDPEMRDVEARLAAGWLLIDKPAGPSSHQVSAWARDIIKSIRSGVAIEPRPGISGSSSSSDTVPRQ